MYITPVVYAIPKEGIMKTIMEWNPFTPIILTTRDFVLGAEPVYMTYFLVLLLISIPLFFIGLLLYRISIPIIVERMSA
jgi:lipopolysaccharide transport system permease protein